ncbi:MAG: MFS transporter [Acidobacteria bacterium]|nr:MFS transporter [Acidobacteriota bacterium]
MRPSKDQQRFFTAPLIIIYITVFIDLVGFGMVIPILPFYANTYPFHATPFQVGLLFSIYSWMQFIFAPMLGRLSDRYGRRPILLVSLFGSAVGYYLMGAAETLALVFVGRIVGGITGANISTAQAYIADVTTKENRARGMGLFGAMFGLGFVLGPAIAGILSKYGVHVPFYVAAVLSLANVTALYFLLPETRKQPAEDDIPESGTGLTSRFGVLRRPIFGTLNLLYFLLVTSFSIMTYAFVLFTAYRFGYNAEQNGYLFAYVGMVAIVCQGFLFNVLVKRYGESLLAVAGCLLLSVSLFVMPFAGPLHGGLAGLMVICALLSLGNAMASPALTSLASKISSDAEQGSSMGIMQSGASLARAIGPIIGGLLLNNAVDTLDDASVTRTFWTAAAIMLVAVIPSIYSLKQIKRSGAEKAVS